MQKKILIFLLFVSLSLEASSKSFLVFGGKTGWIGQKIVTMLQAQGYYVTAAQSRLENRESIEKEINEVKPDCIINAAGVTGVPNVDWCEDHKQETLRSNIIGALTLFDVALEHNIHVIHCGTGCVYEYDETHPMGSAIGFTEDEKPNFTGSFYSYTKGMLNELIMHYPNVLNLRLRMPISDDLHPRSLITKITQYKKVINIPNSMSVLSDLLPLIPLMAELKVVGHLNFVNPGAISHNKILDLYKEYVDPTFTYENFTVEEQDAILKARRSNNRLDTTRLQKIAAVPNIKEAIRRIFQNMKPKNNERVQ